MYAATDDSGRSWARCLVQKDARANVQGRVVAADLVVDVNEFFQDETMEARFEIRASGKQRITLNTIQNNVPDALSVLAVTGGILRDGSIDLNETPLEPSQTHDVSVIFRFGKEGTVDFAPRLVYTDESGRDSAELFPPAQLQVRGQSSVLEFLARAFVEDYDGRRLSIDRAGWRGLLEIVESAGIPKNQVYGDSRYSRGFGRSLESLLKARLVEHRSFSGRGRGGNVTKIRARYDQEIVRRLVDRVAVGPLTRPS